MRSLQTNQSNRRENQKFSSQGARPEEFLRSVSEVHEKPDIELEIIVTITALIIDEPITTVERNRKHQEARTEAEIGRTRVVPSRQRQQ